jgi:hypothetical protein
MTKKLSKANIALIFFTAILLLSVYAQIQYQTHKWSGIEPYYQLDADKLNDKPQKYFTLTNPDQYVLKAINGEYVYPHYDDTQIDELIRQHQTSNIEYNGSYFSIGLVFVDAFPPPTLPYILAGFALSILGIVVIEIFQVAKRFKPPKK